MGESAEPGVNRLLLTAQITAKEVMRYSPAGVPILVLELQHVSMQTEAGSERQIEMTMTAKAAGAIADQLDRQPLSMTCNFAGFIAKKSRNSRQLVFHITAYT